MNQDFTLCIKPEDKFDLWKKGKQKVCRGVWAVRSVFVYLWAEVMFKVTSVDG